MRRLLIRLLGLNCCPVAYLSDTDLAGIWTSSRSLREFANNLQDRLGEKRKDAIIVDAVSSYKDKLVSSIEAVLERRMPFTDMGVGEVEGLKQALIIINSHD